MWLKSSSHYKVPFAIVIFSLIAIGFMGYSQGGDDGAELLVKIAAMQALFQFPIGLVILLICSRLFTFDFGTFGTISLKILAISFFEEAVAMGLYLFASIPPTSLISIAVSFVIFLFMIMILFETSGAETWIIAGVTLLASYGINHLHDSKSAKPQNQGRAQQSAPAKRNNRSTR